MVYAIILAGGNSQRFKRRVPKQFIDLAGKPLLLWSLLTFSRIKDFKELIVVLPKGWFEFGKDTVLSHLEDERLQFVAGGSTRTDSLLKALAFVREKYGVKDEDIAVTHDAARPFVRSEHIVSSIKTCENCSAVTLALPVIDTIAICEKDRIVSLTDRRRTFVVQTPQTFKIKTFLELFERLTEEQRSALTDATGVFVMNNVPVSILEGDPRNIKVTTQLDLVMAEAIARSLSE
ncbi:MAG: 2-C-methyl-D-erythritol 4-phosphate cytidylyltransferase [Thermotoga sp. 50_1627]|uniref:2-C-methyl-D-erythritol 4-phosphate cytidylyltransferase n=1 Tax=Pseudothermotoga sp. TaxID=2033661 RepID=UPI00076DD227|nr:MAG: 2-C-methyl-D-erythritol 4-phosphate cytidylyltransferase [Thermotoga sp. 50_64]KUK25079.1 MAG: 2-C-methyl-D-erythritol 4-phosphate cytidylyltransferase [Thermotoga sp. 50_1627]MBC7116012.1 2-C-methyl-D-erythritol 4-phosphate cytidylyltransferase [Pseudothermotoga sp.]MDK2923851.1 D-ribitol-5-phosphate cytidylyltransferase [Pseudothermotoga sp.]HBT39491.1 2-C-methyl-D-erythritol 4-phosphate cytidylyltransferase [Pseudothermotoga sp.]